MPCPQPEWTGIATLIRWVQFSHVQRFSARQLDRQSGVSRRGQPRSAVWPRAQWSGVRGPRSGPGRLSTLSVYHSKSGLYGVVAPEARARSHYRFVLPLIHFTPESLMYLVSPFLKRQCDRTLGRAARTRGPRADPLAVFSGTNWCRPAPVPRGGPLGESSEKDAKLAQKLGQLQPA